MRDRYIRLFSLSDNLYTEGAPVLILAGALLKDTQTGQLLAQLKMLNIVPQKTKAVMVRIAPLDITGKSLGETVEYQYLDLNVARDETFGQKTPIVLPDPTTRGYTASVTEVVFSDNSIWSGQSGPWEPFTKPPLLADVIQDEELIKQYKIKYGERCTTLFSADKDIWFCACGAINHSSENTCHTCGNPIEATQAIDWEDLKRERDLRLEKEAEAQEDAARKNEERRKRAKVKSKRIIKICIPIVAIVAICFVAIVIINKVIIPINKYNHAVELLENGKYLSAKIEFESLGDYRDSPTKLEEAKNAQLYIEADELYVNGSLIAARQRFIQLDDYSDAIERAESISEEFYSKGIELFKNKQYQEAIESFKNAGKEYKDAADYIIFSEVIAIDYDDGNLHNLGTICTKINTISNDSMKKQLLNNPQMEVVKTMEGLWYLNGDRRAPSLEFLNGKTATYSIQYKNGNYYLAYYGYDHYDLITDITASSFKSTYKEAEHPNMNHTWTYLR